MHEGGFFERCPIYLTKNHHMDKKVRQREARMGSCLLRSKFASRKLKTLVKTRFVSKDVLFQETLEYGHAIMICYKSLIFAFISPCSICSDLGYCKGND
jgi:hypothetical protein